MGLWGVGVTGNVGAFGGTGGGTAGGATASLGAVYFADSSAPLGFTSGGYISEGAFAGSHGGQWGNSADGGNVGGGGGAGASVGAIFTNAKSVDDLAGPFTDTTILLPWVSIDYAVGANGVQTLSVTAGPAPGIGFFHYCTNTWTNPVSDASFPSSGKLAGRNCGCAVGP
jgi:hypothetical protein